MAADTKPRESWGTRLGVIMAVMGSAVGLGNFLRFPGLAAKYEGGAFMIPYFIALFLLGLPLAWAEWAMGRYGGARGHSSTPGIYRAIWPRKFSPYLGVLGMLVPVGIYMYYVVIEAWCLAYAWFFLTGAMADLGRQAAMPGAGVSKQAYVDFFNNFVGISDNGQSFAMTSSHEAALLFVVICFVLNFWLIYRGLSKGIEKFCLIAMPALVVCALLVLVRVLTLDNVNAGLGFMWNLRTPNTGGFWESLANPNMWLAATSQIFFTLSVGFGIIITYASYLKRDDDVALSSLTSCAGNEFCEVALGGMITIPAAFIFLGSVEVTQAAESSFNLGFKTLPMVFASMPLGQPVGFLFFFLLFLAAITSSISMLQPAIALLEEGLGLNRKASVSMLGFVTLVGTLFVLYFSKSLVALDTFDFWVGTFCIFILALYQTILFGWVLGVEKGMAEIERGAAIKVPRIIGYVLKYVSSTYLTVIFLAWLYVQITQEKDNYFAAIRDNQTVRYSVGFLVIVAVFFALMVGQSVRRWRKQEAKSQEVSR
ncbi:MAG: sodium-dependent transporter [Verrucomicrobiae bacterium]|nr:sodium-dependent transporter [Verrucomicrobiae bacterium]